jgi:hypothetical protein
VIAILIGTLLEQVVFARFPRNADSAFQLLTVVDVGALALCVAIASFLAAALSKRFVSGVIAGIVLVLVSQGLAFIISLATLLQTPSIQALLQEVAGRVSFGVVFLLVATGLGAGSGALGALLGRALVRRSPGRSS